MANLHSEIAAVTDRVIERSRPTRAAYLALIDRERENGVDRPRLGCANLAHGFAGTEEDRDQMKAGRAMNIGIVTAYNDMLSAHATYYRYPEQMKIWAREVGVTAQVAGGVPAMCDGVTQGYAGMELSLFSRDTIALSTAIALSHGMFESAALLGICDKIVPGLLMGALRFGHLPAIFIPGGPMPSGLPNKEKAKVRELYAEGKASRDELLDAEIAAYHSKGTCTFYGTANSNQMMMEMMGLHLPGAAFVTPNTPLRDALTAQAPLRAIEIADGTDAYAPMSAVVDEKSIVNAIVGLLATGGSTNHTLHIVAMARAAGVIVDWTDFDELSRITPLMARVYPNGSEDVNAFHAAGGMAYVVRQLLDAGLAHDDVVTIAGPGLRRYQQEPFLEDGKLVWREGPTASLNPDILRPANDPFLPEGGIRLLSGGLGRAVIKTSAVKDAHLIIEAPAIVFEDQDELLEAYKNGELNRDFVAVVRFQGPQANGMPELHSLTPVLGVLQDKGFKVALVTDGRMSGASGKVPAAIHVSPEAGLGGPLAYVRTGDVVRLDAHAGVLEVVVEPAELAARPRAPKPAAGFGYGRELFGAMRRAAGPAEAGACTLFGDVA